MATTKTRTKSKTAAPTTEAVEATFSYLDPARLVENAANPRGDLNVTSGLVATARARGIIEPLVVTTTDTDGEYMVIAGHRRLAAARKAGLDRVPCLIRADLAGKAAEQLVDELVENDHRDDLTDLERAEAYAQLQAFGYSATKIVRETGRKRAQVTSFLAVGTSAPVVQAAHSNNLTFEQAAALTEFDDDPEVVAALAKIASEDSRWSFEHAVSQHRQDRHIAAEHARLVAEHTAAGISVIEDAPTDDGDALDVPRPLSALTDADGNPLTNEAHAGCPGHAVYIRHDTFTPRPRYLCLDPSSHGHRYRFAHHAPGGHTPGIHHNMPEGPTRGEVIAGNKAWRAAEPVRASYIRELLKRQTVPAGTLRFVTQEILAAPNRVGDGDDSRLSDLTGVSDSGGFGYNVGPKLVARTKDKRLPLALLAQVATDREATLNVQTWRHKDPTAARWFQFLESTGYTLSEIEQRVVTDGTGSDDDTPDAPERDDTEGGTVVEFPAPAERNDPDNDTPEPPEVA